MNFTGPGRSLLSSCSCSVVLFKDKSKRGVVRPDSYLAASGSQPPPTCSGLCIWPDEGRGPLMHFAGPVPPVFPSLVCCWEHILSSSTKFSGQRCGRPYLSQPPAKHRCPPRLYGPQMCPRPRGTISASSPPPSSSGPTVLSSAGPLVVLFLRNDRFAESDHGLP